MLSSVWDSFSLPYRIAIFSSFIIWIHQQRRRYPGLIIFMIYSIIKVITRRLIKGPLNPKWRLETELIADTGRKLLVHIDNDVLDNCTALVKLVAPLQSLEIRAPKFKAIWYGNRDAKNIILYIHGGAYVFGTAHMYLRFFKSLMEDYEKEGVSCSILSLDYTLAPQGVFPKATEECVAAYEYLLKNLSINPKNIVVAGDSAGGALSLSLCYQIKESYPLPAGLILFSPWVDSRNNLQMKKYPEAKYDILDADFIENAIQLYMQGTPQNHLSSPILGNTQGLPKTLMIAGGKEIFIYQINEFAKKFKEENGEDKLIYFVEPEMIHVYSQFIETDLDAHKRSNQMITQFLKQTFQEQDQE